MTEMTPPLNEAEELWEKKRVEKLQEIIDRIIESRKSLRPKDFDEYLKKVQNRG